MEKHRSWDKCNTGLNRSTERWLWYQHLEHWWEPRFYFTCKNTQAPCAREQQQAHMASYFTVSWGSDPALTHPASAFHSQWKKLCRTNWLFSCNLPRKNAGSATPYKKSLGLNPQGTTLLKIFSPVSLTWASSQTQHLCHEATTTAPSSKTCKVSDYV